MRRICVAALVAAVLAVIVQSVAVAAVYPSPLPDFAHPGSPHFGFYSPAGGAVDRPVLLIYRQFSDIPQAAGQDAAWLSQRFFGPGFPNARDYFNQASFNDMNLFPATESQGTANDGVVIVNNGTSTDYTSLSDGDRTRNGVDAADPFVDYSIYDDNNDGTIDTSELVVMQINVQINANDNCGATRGVTAGMVDGKNIGFSVGLGSTGTNLITHIHELHHIAMDVGRDFYGFGIGSLDVSGPTCGPADTTFFGVNAWHKTHLGWISPMVVTRDGYYTVDNAYTTPEAFILYDPDKDTNNYFIVENRQRTAGTYEQNISDSGLVIWRVDDAVFNSADEAIRPIEIMRADGGTNAGCGGGFCYGGSNGDAWDPLDVATPQRTMARNWQDGTASNVAVRAIGPSGNAIRAYFDVRGPGVLVDPTTATGQPMTVEVTPEEANPISFTVMNTGETTDTFNFTVTGLPVGWTATTHTMTLGPGAGGVANVLVTVPADAAVGDYAVKAVGTSTSDSTVTTQCGFTLRVVLHATEIVYTGATSMPWGDGAGFQAQLNDVTDPSEIIDGATVTFTLDDGVNSQTAVAISDSAGVASANPILTLPPGVYDLVVSMDRHGKHGDAAIFTLDGYEVLKRPTTIVYSGDLTAEYSDPANLVATITDGISGVPLADKAIDFVLGTQSAADESDAAGLATAVIVIIQPAGDVSVSAAFAGDSLYLPSSDSDTFTIDKEDLTFVYTGDTLVDMLTTPELRAQATQETDGSLGDLSLAEARFLLTPTLTTTPFDYTTGVDGTGAALTPATGLPVDLWTVSVSVPDSNPYWEGASLVPAELVVYDPRGQITGGTQGDDVNGNETSLNMTGRYHDSAPRGPVRFYASAGQFSGSDFRWIVVVGQQAVFELDGTLDGTQTVMRVRVNDVGEPAAGADTYQAQIRNMSGTELYSSGLVPVERGNLQVRLVG